MKQTKCLEPKIIIQKLSKMKAHRSLWENHWQEIADYFLTNKSTITTSRTEGDKRTWQLLDNTGAISLETLAAALNSYLTSNEWIEASFGDENIDNVDSVRAYLQYVTQLMLSVLKFSNFETAIQEFYQEILAFGTGSVFVEEHKEKIVSFTSLFIRDYYIKENRDGRVDTVFRKFNLKAHDIVEMFPKAAAQRSIEASLKVHDDKDFCIIHAIYPSSVVGEKNGKYVSQYILESEQFELDKGEFNEFPYGITRWSKAAGETYGRSPAMSALPEMKVLNTMNKTMLRGAQKLVDPPILMPDDGLLNSFSADPGSILWYRAGTQDQIKTLQVDTRLDFGYQAMEDRRKRVREAFYIDQLRLPQNGPMMTATEVSQRKQEGLIFLGPMFGRIEPEFLRPLLYRVYAIMSRKGLIPPAPPQAQGRAIEIRFTGLIAKANDVGKAQAISSLVATVTPFLQMNQGAMDNFNTDAIIRIVARALNVPSEALNDLDTLMQQRQAQAQAQAQQQQAAMQAQMQQQNADTSLNVAKAMEIAQGINQ